MNLLVLEPAELELKEAYTFYNARVPGLGVRFLESFKDAVSLIEKLPLGWRKIAQNTRRVNVIDFP
jgi:hypothetical protein